jgi:crossover junction endodeoxyribonuclease RuvC
VKRAVVGYGRADKRQMQQMIKMLLGLDAPPSPHDAADALAVALCHLHSSPRAGLVPATPRTRRRTHLPKSWRQYRPPSIG